MNVHELKLYIAGIFVVLKSSNKEVLDVFSNKYTSFVVEDVAQDHFCIRISHDFEVKEKTITVKAEEGIFVIDGGDFCGRVNVKERIVDASMRAEITTLNSFLRVFYSAVMIFSDGFLIHSAGLKRENKGFLFIGPSESGKTTTARNADGFEVLNDELVAVRKKNGAFYLYSTPFHGEYEGVVNNAKVLLSTVFFLNKNLVFQYEPRQKMQVMLDFMENVFFFNEDLASNQRLLSICNEISQSKDGYQINVLACENLGGVVDDIRAGYCLAK